MRTKDLIEIQRKEKVSPYLQDLGENFYQEVKALIQRKYTLYYEKKDEDFSSVSTILKELENIKNIAQDLYETRERKIVSNALYFVKSGEEIEYENLTREEVEVMSSVIEVLRENRRDVLNFSYLKEGIEEPPRTQGQEKEVEEEKEESISYVTVKILASLPAIVGIDGKIYGDFKEEDVVTLPQQNAKALINRGEAREIKLRAP